MKIILTPAWLSHVHWLIMGSAFTGLATYCWLLYGQKRNILSMLYGIAWTSAALICASFWLIQTEITGIDATWLFAVERSFWWRRAFSAAVIVDIHAADFNGHRSMSARLHASRRPVLQR